MNKRINNTTGNAIYYSNNGQFSSLSKDAVKKWNRLVNDKDELDYSNKLLWMAKGHVHASTYNISFLVSKKAMKMNVTATFYSEACKKIKRIYPHAVFMGKEKEFSPKDR